MKMNYTLLASTLTVALLGQANAADYSYENITVTPYARVVGGISYANHGFEAGETGSVTEVASNQWGTSYAGAAMTVKISDEFRGIANIESGFGTINGETNIEDKLFNRKANVGLQHDTYGQITFGTHLMLTQDIIASDPMAFQSIGINTLVNGVNDTFAENSVVYRSPEYFGFKLALMQKFGGRPSDSSRDEGSAVELSYQYEGLKVQAIYQENADEFGRYTGGEFYGLGTQGQWLYAKTTVLGASYKFGDTTVFAGYEDVEAKDSGHLLSYTFDDEAEMGWVGVNYAVSDKLTVNAAYYYSKKSYSDKESDLYALGINYAFNENFLFYTTVGYINNNTVDAALLDNVGANGHALAYWDLACENAASCDGASQMGGYTGVVLKL